MAPCSARGDGTPLSPTLGSYPPVDLRGCPPLTAMGEAVKYLDLERPKQIASRPSLQATSGPACRRKEENKIVRRRRGSIGILY